MSILVLVGEGVMLIRVYVIDMSDMRRGIFSSHAYQSTIIASHLQEKGLSGHPFNIHTFS